MNRCLLRTNVTSLEDYLFRKINILALDLPIYGNLSQWNIRILFIYYYIIIYLLVIYYYINIISYSY